MAKAKKSKAKKPAKKKAKAGKPVKSRRARAKSKGAKAKKASKGKKAAARKPVKKSVKKAKQSAPKKKQIMGEGDYAATRAFDKDQTAFVKRNKAKIPEMGREAEKALDGPEGDSLRAAEQEAMNRSTID